jgi:hypothetical protein
MDRKVAGEAAVGEPAALKLKLAVALLLVTLAAYSGTALSRKGKLRLMRAPSRIGRSFGAGRGW